MGFTRHGYHIPNSPNDTVTIPTFRIDCEGPLLCLECKDDINSWRSKAVHRGINDPNSGEGWFEFIHPTRVTAHIAYVRENGEIYLPESGLTDNDFFLSAAKGGVHRLVRADDVSEL